MNRKSRRKAKPSTPIETLNMGKFDWLRHIMSDTNDLPALTRLVLHTIGMWMDDKSYDGESWKCYPSMEILSKASGMCERSFRTHVALARAAGWIRTEERGSTKGWHRYEYFPHLPDGAAARAGASDAASTEKVKHGPASGADGPASGALGAASDDIMARHHVPTTNHIPINTNQLTNARAALDAPPSIVKKSGKKPQQELQPFADILPNLGEKPVSKKATAPPEAELEYFLPESVLGITAKTISHVPSLNLQKATTLLRQQIEQRGLEAVEARCRQAPTDPIKCLVHVQQRDS